MKDNDNTSSDRSSACPVSTNAGISVDGSSKPHSWSRWLQFGGVEAKNGSGSNASGCPVERPASLEEAAAYPQDPHPDQKGVRLSTHRVVSSIPRGATTEGEGPHHQPTSSSTPSHWIYPSEQQFFHALRKKGWDHVEASNIPSVLEIHNTINERTWKQVQEWEAGMDRNVRTENGAYVETDLKLVRFIGRPNDISPQAFLWTKVLRWNDPPFDRHDWYVQKQPRNPGAVVPEFPIQRYVIDYYYLPPAHPDMPPTPFVDARPALDGPRALYQRACRLVQEELPALTYEYNAWRARQRRYWDGGLPNNGDKETTNRT